MSKKILVAVDFCKTAREAVEFARDLFIPENSKITFFHVVPDPSVVYNSYASTVPLLMEVDLDKLEHESMEEVKGCIDKTFGEFADFKPQYEIVVKSGDPADEILDYAEKNKYDLVIVGHKTKKAYIEFLVGSVADKVVKHARCPVLVFRP